MFLRRSVQAWTLASAMILARAAVDNVTLSTSAPSGVQPLHPRLVSFSLEQDRWTDWAGTTSVNQVCAFFDLLECILMYISVLAEHDG
jgi:hypothetical protein